ncbi:MAG TPA: Hsp20/alpha crystallin family protein [Candidatus Binataceae bacterium]|nr:Hsp20/alpha crystallin family protein [Candidatus Binataceae bacterium]
MALIKSWSPFRELERFRREFDDLYERLLGAPMAVETGLGKFAPAVESFVEGDALTIRAEMPGIEPKDIEVTVSGDMLTVRGSREEKEEKKGRNYSRKEMRYGAFERTVELAEGVKAEDVKAVCRDGVLTVTVPVPKALQQKEVKVQVEGAGEARKIEAKPKAA